MTIDGSHGSGARAPGKPPPRKMIDLVEAGRANPVVVRDLLEELRKAWEEILNRYAENHDLQTERGGVNYVDGWMTGHNFFKLLLDHLVEEAGLKGEAAAQVYLGAGATFMNAMQARATKVRS